MIFIQKPLIKKSARLFPLYNIILSGLLSCFLIGCQSVKAPQTPYDSWDPPDRDTAKETDTASWNNLKQQTTKINTAKPLTLIELIDIALSNNPSTQQAWENARVAEAQKAQAESQWLPQANVSGSITKAKQETGDALSSIDQLQYGPALNMTYLLLDFGGRTAAVTEAAQMLLAANFQFNQALQDLLLNVETAYYSFYSTQSSLEAAEANLLDAQTTYKAAEEKYSVGLDSKPDLLEAEATYNDALYTLEEAKGELETAKANLAQLLSLPADTPLQIVPPQKEIPTDISKEDVSKLILEAVQERPDIKALKAQLMAKKAAITAATSDMLPSLNASGSAVKDWYKYYKYTKPYDDDYSYSGNLSVNWDIFDGFYNLNKRRAAEADAAALEAQLIQAELEAGTDVWTSYYNFKTAVRKLTYGKAALKSAQAAYDLELESYETGLKSILDLLQSQNQLKTARSKLVQSQKDLFVSLANLAHATGSITVTRTNIGNSGIYNMDIYNTNLYSDRQTTSYKNDTTTGQEPKMNFGIRE